jgi:cobalt-zinc-cadmium efflux system protein
MVRTGTDGHAVLDQARSILVERYGISHATLQVEPDDHEGCTEIGW